MKKIYRIIVLFILLIFLTTYNPNNLNIIPKTNNNFLTIQYIEVENNILIEENEITEKLAQISGKNILFVSRKDIESPLKLIDFLEKIEVKKRYPDTIIIKVYETRPIAVLYKKNSKFLIDSLSNLVVFNSDIVSENLPNIFGEGAEKNFINFYDILKDNNFPTKRIKNFYYFQIGRWDLQLTNNQIIKFPKDKADDAIKKSIKLLNHKDFKNYNIIDLRIYGKIITE